MVRIRAAYDSITEDRIMPRKNKASAWKKRSEEEYAEEMLKMMGVFRW